MTKKNQSVSKKSQPESKKPMSKAEVKAAKKGRTLSVNIEYGKNGVDTVSVVADGDSWKHPKLRPALGKLASTLAVLLADAGEPGTLSELLWADFELPELDTTQARQLVKSRLLQMDVVAPVPAPEPEPETTPES
jgi:hypothetical protein